MVSLMASSRFSTCRLKLAVTVAFIFSLSFLPLLSVGNGGRMEEGEKKKKTILGSRPPGCVNKCSSCRPCMAALVIPVHEMKGFKALSSYRGDDDDTYYLVAWKCQCGDQLFQP